MEEDNQGTLINCIKFILIGVHFKYFSFCMLDLTFSFFCHFLSAQIFNHIISLYLYYICSYGKKIFYAAVFVIQLESCAVAVACRCPSGPYQSSRSPGTSG